MKKYFLLVWALALTLVASVGYAAEKSADELAGELNTSLAKLSYSALAMNHAYDEIGKVSGVGSNAEGMNLERGKSAIKYIDKDYAKLLNFAGMVKSVDSSKDYATRVSSALIAKLNAGSGLNNIDKTVRGAKLMKHISDNLADGSSSELNKIVKAAKSGVKKGANVKKYEAVLENAQTAQELLRVRKEASKSFDSAIKAYDKKRDLKISKEEIAASAANFMK